MTRNHDGRDRRGRGGRRTRWAGRLEQLEVRTLLNASIDIAADGSLLYRTDSETLEQLRISRVGDVYTFEVDPTNEPIDILVNDAALPVTGSGTQLVTVEGPISLRIEMTGADQSVLVESTGVPTAVDMQSDGGALVLGGAEGVQALAGEITVTGADETTGNSLTVDDVLGVYAVDVTPSYVVTADQITANDPVVQAEFLGVTYSGIASVNVLGTTQSQDVSALFLVYSTADGVATSIDAGGFVGDPTAAVPHVAVLGTSADETSSLAIGSEVRVVISIASASSPTTILPQEAGASIRIEGVRGENYGLESSLVVLTGETGSVDLSIANYWNPTQFETDTNWFLGFDPGGSTDYAALRDAEADPSAGVYYRPGALHSLSVDARGNHASSMMVDFRNGNPLPFGPAAEGATNLPRPGLAYIGTSVMHEGSPYALSFVGDLEAAPYAAETHVAVPLYRGVITLTETEESAPRYVAYQLDADAPLFDDALPVEQYEWFYEIMEGALEDDTRLSPDGEVVSAVVPSDLALTDGGLSIASRQTLRIVERNADAFMAETLISDKAVAQVSRSWSLSTAETTIEYASSTPVAGLTTLYVVDQSPESIPLDDEVVIQALPPDVTVYILQNEGDDVARVSAVGVAAASFVGIDGGPGENILIVDADQEVLRNDALDNDQYAIVKITDGLGVPLFYYSRYQQPPEIVNPSPDQPPLDGVALQVVFDLDPDGKPKKS